MKTHGWTKVLKEKPEGHRVRGLGTLFCIEFAPDGERIATGGGIGVVLWDIRARRVLGRLAGEVAPVVAIAFSRDGRRIAALGQNGEIAICETSSFETVAVVRALQDEGEAHFDPGEAPRLLYGADAETLLVLADEGAWLVEGKKARRLSGEEDAPFGEAVVAGFSAAGEIVVIEEGATAFYVKGATKKSKFVRQRQIAFLASSRPCAVSGDGRFLFAGVAGAKDSQYAVVSLETGDVLATPRFSNDLYAIRFAFRAPVVFVDVYGKPTLVAFPERVGGEVRALPGGGALEKLGVFDHWIVAPNGDFLASGDSYHGKIAFRDLEGREKFPWLGRYIYESDSAVMLCGGDAKAERVVLMGCIGDGQNSSTWVHLFDLAEDRPGAVLSEEGPLFCMGVASIPGTDLVAVPLDNDGLMLADFRTGEGRILEEEEDAYQNAAVGMNGAVVASGSANGYLTFWDRESGRVLARVRAHAEQICGLDWQPNGDLLASSSQDGTVRLWSAKALLALGKSEKAKPLAVVSVGGMLYRVTFSSDGVYCAVGIADGAACVIHASDGALVCRVGRSSSEVMALAFHPRTGELVTGSGDGTFSVWNVQTGKSVFSHAYQGKSEEEPGLAGVTGLCFDAAGDVLVLSHMDGTIRIWDLPSI